ncbi:MAG: membrane protein insertion efficiency factor YidD [Bosea sp.]|nr:membrane protein insertion efficiency factor YidD [Bosea sp. (in: a-proteobacteria)]
MATTQWRARQARRPGTICTSTAHRHDGPAEHRDPPKGGRLSLPALGGIALIRAYKLLLSPFIGQSCRYLPTCSSYGEEAIGRYGLWAGGWMTLARLQRCGPLGASGFDPVPETLRPDASWYLPWRYGRWTGRHIDPKTRLDR